MSDAKAADSASAMSRPRRKASSATAAHCRSRLGRLGQQVVGLGDHPVVGQGERRRPTGSEPLSECRAWSRSKSGGGVDGRSTPASGSLTPTASPAKRIAAPRVVQPEVVLGMARRVDGHQHPVGSTPDLLAVVEHVDALGRGGIEAAVEGVEQRPVDAGGRVDQPGRVGQMASPLGVHVDGGRGEGPGHVAHPAGMVEMDVGDDDSGELVRAHAEGGQLVEEHRHRALAARSRRARVHHPRSGTRPSPAPSRRAGCRSRARRRRRGVPPRRTGGCSSWLRAPSEVVTSGGGAPVGGGALSGRGAALDRGGLLRAPGIRGAGGLRGCTVAIGRRRPLGRPLRGAAGLGRRLGRLRRLRRLRRFRGLGRRSRLPSPCSGRGAGGLLGRGGGLLDRDGVPPSKRPRPG